MNAIKDESMTRIVHIANTHVEFEFSSPFKEPLEQALCRYPSALQLQFLPLLYASPSDIVAVTQMPDDDYLACLEKHKQWGSQGLPSLGLLRDISCYRGMQCASWGPSLQVKEWAAAREVDYFFPDWSVAEWINSKAFSLRYSALQEAELVSNEKELCDWLKKNQGPKVLKKCFGLAGQGNFRIDQECPTEELLTFCRKEWLLKRPLIAEPWLDRIEDFSTQWLIHPDRKIEWVGATRFETDEKGIYQGTLAGPIGSLFCDLHSFLQEHCVFVQKALKDIADLGFFGSLGIDAFVYRDPQNQKICLNPLVEINGRQTMSLVALRLQQRICPLDVLRLSFQRIDHSHVSFLPSKIVGLKKKIGEFRRKLIVEVRH